MPPPNVAANHHHSPLWRHDFRGQRRPQVWNGGGGMGCHAHFPKKVCFLKLKPVFYTTDTPPHHVHAHFDSRTGGNTPPPPHTHPHPFRRDRGVQPSPLAFRRNREVPHPPLPILTQRRGYYPLHLCLMRQGGYCTLPVPFRSDGEGSTLSICILTQRGGLNTLPLTF